MSKLQFKITVDYPLTKKSYKELDLSNTKVKNDKELFCHIIGTTANFCYDVKKKVLYCYSEEQLIKEVFPGEMNFDEFKYRRKIAIIESINEITRLN